MAGAKDIRYAGIGGVSALLGWTEVQQQDKEEAGDRLGNIIKIVSAGNVGYGIAAGHIFAMVVACQVPNTKQPRWCLPQFSVTLIATALYCKDEGRGTRASI